MDSGSGPAFAAVVGTVLLWGSKISIQGLRTWGIFGTRGDSRAGALLKPPGTSRKSPGGRACRRSRRRRSR
eukprot:6158563-Pyramimonas_sp.AAC.1